jgi:hypothetical protein
MITSKNYIEKLNKIKFYLLQHIKCHNISDTCLSQMGKVEKLSIFSIFNINEFLHNK